MYYKNGILKNNLYQTKFLYSLKQNIENCSKIVFYWYSSPKIAVFQIFHTRFFDGHFFGLQEGSMKSEILLPPMPSFENLVSVLSLVWDDVCSLPFCAKAAVVAIFFALNAYCLFMALYVFGAKSDFPYIEAQAKG